MKEVIIKIVLILLLALCIMLCMPRVSESEAEEPATATVTVEPIIIQPEREATTVEPIKYEIAEEPIEKYTKEEKEIIAKVVHAEARGEEFGGQVAVAVVVLKRYESGKFGKSIRKVAYAAHQFANSTKYNDENMRAVEYAIDHLDDYPDNMYYFQRANRKFWGKSKTIKRYCRIGAHTFYTAGEPEGGKI